MPAKNRVLIGAWITPEEKDELAALARQARLNVSELERRLATGRAKRSIA
ncbi:plasmid mobilization protein [Varunaivibrio sulfuroxidans]|uniref:Uncharacterized protein n=1 Tax=Varunaivibrio sulfuroxidans TaxID=1773489 RepID=A0A4R3J666_9PROT|nr:hypothetical protein [Varunaivibrio sulfuroxidans]TCS60847.1 hypothetical protein EDD55_1097 [Varunaivibrio sulfuroxidans]WES31739.1 hypothetical protein P3M64_05050 [Varunaivibrio sulfuroxidans]